MLTLTDKKGDPVFEVIQITLVCNDCLQTETPERCTHKLASMPRWLSSEKVEVVRQLLAEDPAMLLRESLGISADGSEKAFNSVDIDNFFARRPDPIRFHHRQPELNTDHVFVAVDPSGGGASAFAMASLIQLPSGAIQVHACSRSAMRTSAASHISHKIFTSTTMESGHCDCSAMKRGITSGSTRFTRSLVLSRSSGNSFK